MFLGYPLFPGEDEKEQLMYMIEYLGIPPEKVLKAASRYQEFFDAKGQPFHVVNSKGKVRVPGSKRIVEKVNSTDKKFLNLIESKKYLGCLEWDPQYRLNPKEILLHSWLANSNRKRNIID